MPNWCNNTLRITGPKAKIESLWQSARSGDDFGLLQAMVPMPKALHDTTSPCEPDDVLQEKYGASNWYDWAVHNWGTKWDISDEGLEYEDTEDGYATISGWFDSAWAPPIEAYNKFLEENADCSLESFYEEGGMDFAGHYDNGADDFLDGISTYARLVVQDKPSGSTLYDFLDGELELTESRREYIEDELNEDAQKVHDFIVEGKAVNGTMKEMQ